MTTSNREKQQAVEKVATKLNITVSNLFKKLDEFNKRARELNQKTIDYAKMFIVPKGKIVDNKIEYDLNDEDRAILSGYKQKVIDTLTEEFPELFEVMDDLKILEDDNLNYYK